VPAPTQIVDGLESVIDIFLSGVRHRERAAFILCDNLVELACKTKARQEDYTFDTSCNFHDAWNAPGVELPERTLGRRIQDFRDVRNRLQHENAAITVDSHYCATAIVTAAQVIDQLWPNTLENNIQYWMQVAIRVIQLYSDQGDANIHRVFEDQMQEIHWRGPDREYVRVNSVQIQMGRRDYWHIAVRQQPALVEECLRAAESVQ
jgi:hypothetical protein